MKFKECISLVLATTLVYTSCNQVRRSTPSQKPEASQAATKSQIDDTENKILVQQNTQAGSNGTMMNNAAVNKAIDAMIAQGSLAIKDFEGNNVSSETYKLNPGQYFLLLKNKDSNGYRVLNSTAGKGASNGLSQASKDFFLSYKVYNVDGSMNSFKGANLGEPVKEDAVDLTATASAALNNKAEINGMIERMQSNEVASNASFSDQLTNLILPTAHAGDWTKKDSYLTVAIIFSSVALISYLFALWGFGNLTLAVGIVFWFLYWFYEQPEY